MTSTFPNRSGLRPIPDRANIPSEPAGSPTALVDHVANATSPRPAGPALILPFRRRSQRQPTDQDLDRAVAHAIGLLTSGHLDEAERRFDELSTSARTLRQTGREADWHLPAWLGGVVCHALRCEWLAAEMAACEHLSEMPVERLATIYIDAVALGNQWLANAPQPHPTATDHVGPVERRRFPRNADPAPDRDSDPARDYSYALVSALRFRLGD